MPFGRVLIKHKMENTKLSQLLRIISRERTAGMDLRTRIYDSKDYRKYNRNRQRNIMRQEDYKNKNYMQNKNINKK